MTSDRNTLEKYLLALSAIITDGYRGSLAQLPVAPYLFGTAGERRQCTLPHVKQARTARSSHFIFKAQADVSENAIAKYNTVHYLYPGAPQKEIS